MDDSTVEAAPEGAEPQAVDSAEDVVKAARLERDAAKSRRREAEARAESLAARVAELDQALAESTARATGFELEVRTIRAADVMAKALAGVPVPLHAAGRALVEGAIAKGEIDVRDASAADAATTLLRKVGLLESRPPRPALNRTDVTVPGKPRL